MLPTCTWEGAARSRLGPWQILATTAWLVTSCSPAEYSTHLLGLSRLRFSVPSR